MAPRRRGTWYEGSNPPDLTPKGTQFFKIILPAVIRNRQLAIPKKFVSKFGKNLSANASLEIPNGAVWPVRLKEADGSFWFQSGLQEFVDYYSVRVGYFLVFRYTGNSHFHVSIFDMSACEIDYPVDVRNFEETNHVGERQLSPSEEIEKDEEDDDVQILAEFFPSQTRKNKIALRHLRSSSLMRLKRTFKTRNGDHLQELDPSLQLKGVGFHRSELSKSIEYKFEANYSLQEVIGKQDCPTEEGDRDNTCITKRLPSRVVSTRSLAEEQERNGRALEAARAFKSENPFFIVAMQPSYVSGKFCLNVPLGFAKRFLSGFKDVILEVPDRRTWPARGSFRVTYAKLNKGWDVFVCDNHVEQGDACVFELVKFGTNKLKVFIFRKFWKRGSSMQKRIK